MRSRMRLEGLAGLVAALSMGAAFAGEAPEWPQFHGPRRDNMATETGLLKQWPEGGPKLLWAAKGIGHGFSHVAIAGGLLYITGNIGADTVITALDLDGDVKWRVKNGPADKFQNEGARSTPTLDGDRLYHKNGHGDLVCLKAESGEKLWGLNIVQKFGGRMITWGLAESPLIDGTRVIVTPGGEDIGIVALDKMTGGTVWTCHGTKDKPGYASGIVFEHQGLRLFTTMMAVSIVGVNADTGELLWQVKHKTPYDESIFTPIFHDGLLYFTTGHRVGSRLLKLDVEERKCSADLVWSTDKLDNHHGGVLLVDGYLYGYNHGGYKWGWECIEWRTGKLMHSVRTPTQGSVTYADGMIYAMNERRLVELIRPTPERREVVSSFELPEGGRGPSWAHPVVCGGRLYLRYSDFLYVYDVRD